MKKLSLLLCFLGVIILLSVSCKKDKGDETPPKDYPYYFTANINGGNIVYQADDTAGTDYECTISRPQSSLGSDYDVYEGTTIMDQRDIPSNSIYVHILKYFNHDPSNAERIAMLAVGNYGYGVGNMSPSTVNGASIDYIDHNGNFWTTEYGSQTGSTFSITEIVENPANTSDKIFKATFTCKLYNGTGGTLDVTNATIRGKVLLP